MFIYGAFFTIAIVATFFLFRWWYYEIQINPAMTMSIALFYSLYSKQLSLLFIELIPSLLPEQNLYSYYTGVSWRVLIMHFVFLAGLVVTCRTLNMFFPLRAIADRSVIAHPTSDVTLDLCLGTVVLLLVVQAINIILSKGGAGLEGGFNRYDFWEESARFPLLETIFGKTMAFVPPLIAFGSWGYRKIDAVKRSAFFLMLLAPYWVFLYLTGHRFTMTILNFGLFLGVYLLLRIYEGKSPISRGFAIGTLAVFMLAIVVGSFDLTTRYFAKNSSGAIDAFFERAFVIQGSTLWAVDDAVINQNVRGDLSSLKDGMSTIRNLVLSVESAATYEDRDVNLSAGLPAICQLAFGPIYGSVMIVFFGIYLAMIFHIYSAVIAKGSIVGLCVGALVVSWSNSVYGVASLILIFEWKNALFLLVLSFILAVPPMRLSLARAT